MQAGWKCLPPRRGEQAGEEISALRPWIFMLGFKHFDKGFLWNIDRAEGFHALLAFLLFLKELSLSGDVTTVAFGSNVLAHGADGFTGNNLPANGGLNGDLILLGGNDFLELGCQRAAAGLGFVPMHDAGKRV